MLVEMRTMSEEVVEPRTLSEEVVETRALAAERPGQKAVDEDSGGEAEALEAFPKGSIESSFGSSRVSWTP